MKIYTVNGRKVWLDKAPEGYEEPKTETVKVINTYMTEGEYAVEVKKVLEGRLLREGQFEFELSDSEGVLQTVKNGADGTVKFEPIVFTEEDLEKETEGERAGYFKEKTEKTGPLHWTATPMTRRSRLLLSA